MMLSSHHHVYVRLNLLYYKTGNMDIVNAFDNYAFTLNILLGLALYE